jgi:Predicted metal-dependent hydrolase with the TIM-barrel fold
VCGPVEPAQLGKILHHEHVASLVPGPWLSGGYRSAHHGHFQAQPEAPGFADDQVKQGVAALSGLKSLGFDTVADLSPYGVVGRSDRGENVSILRRISEESGVHIVLGSSTYLDAFSPGWVIDAGLDELTDRFIEDVTVGIGGSGLTAGILGEQATGLGEILPHEELSLRAAARASVATGVALVTHTTHGTMAFEQLQILAEEGADLSRVVIGHMDIQPDLDYLTGVLDAGVNIAFDTIGKQFWDFFLEPGPQDPPEGEYTKRAYFRSDHERAKRLVELVERGYGRQLLVSQDLTGAEVYLNPATHGQWGLGYLGAVFLPLCVDYGLPPQWLDVLARDNPLRLLTVAGR